MLDFTLAKYKDLCLAMLDSGYTPLSVHSYLTDNKTAKNKTVVLRHDVDRKINSALKIAELENDLGVTSTYYFRYPYTFKPGIIENISRLGHETGYHYETLSKSNGDYAKALALFINELEEMRKVCPVNTICMHGCALSRHDNRDIWKIYDFRDFSIIGEAYLSFAQDVRYFTDTGRSWDSKHNIRDFMNGQNKGELINNTDNLIELIRSGGTSTLYTQLSHIKNSPKALI
ncbi:MAG: hypothetical protein PHF87_09705 [Desulfotomaculaceae bacterium]|nr:hypothetical protein [Desulfotomaculaceae bacterium]